MYVYHLNHEACDKLITTQIAYANAYQPRSYKDCRKFKALKFLPLYVFFITFYVLLGAASITQNRVVLVLGVVFACTIAAVIASVYLYDWLAIKILNKTGIDYRVVDIQHKRATARQVNALIDLCAIHPALCDKVQSVLEFRGGRLESMDIKHLRIEELISIYERKKCLTEKANTILNGVEKHATTI